MRLTTLVRLLLASAAFFISAPSAAQVGIPAQRPFGALLSPSHNPNSSPDDMQQALTELKNVGGHVSLIWEWRRTDSEYESMRVLLPLVRAAGLKVFLQLNPTVYGQPSPPEGFAQSFGDPLTRARFISDARRLAALQPDYLNLGGEINLTAALNPNEMMNYASLFRSAYVEVKRVAPGTWVGVSHHLDLFFLYEQKTLIDLLGPQDYIGFTTYPAWTVYKNIFQSIDTIPTLYYSRIRTVVPGKPIIFSEVSWPSGGAGNAADQACYYRLE
jgi:hypothetical protein